MREGMHLKNQMWHVGTASSMWPMRSRRTRASVTSTPQRSQTMPRCLMRLYLPQEHSQSLTGTENAFAEQAALFRLERAVVDGLGILDFALAPGADGIGRRERDPDVIHLVDLVQARAIRGRFLLS